MNNRAFTLIELLVVLAIIVVLAGMLLPAIKLVKTAANKANCGSNMRQVYVAFASYAEDNAGMLPRDYNGVAGSYKPSDLFIWAGPASYLNEQKCNNGWGHFPPVFTCPDAKAQIIRNAESYVCYNYPTYYQNMYAWFGMSQFRTPIQGENTGPVGPVPGTDLPMLIENSPPITGGYHWDWALTRFLWAHNGLGNLMFFDGHVGSMPSTSLKNNLRGVWP